MATLDEARDAWARERSRFKKDTPTRIAYMGDGRGFAASNMIVPGAPTLIYCRESPDSNDYFPIKNRTVQPAFNKQVILGYIDHEPQIEQVLDFIDESVLYQQNASAIGQVKAHRQQHEFGGGDETYTDPRLFTPGLGQPTNPTSGCLYISPFAYYYNSWGRWSGGNTDDLTKYIPSSGSRYILISLDPEINELTYRIGDVYTPETAEFADVGAGWGFVPEPAANEYPITAVNVNQGTTSFNWNSAVLDNITEARLHITPPYKEILDRIETLERMFGVDNTLTTVGAESSATGNYPANAALLQGVSVSETAPVAGNALIYSIANNSWSPGGSMSTVLKQYGVIVNALGVQGAGTVDIDINDGNVATLTQAGNITFTFSNPQAALTKTDLTLQITNDDNTAFTRDWPAGVDWPGGTEPTLTAAASAVDIYTFITLDGGTTWNGFLPGADMQ